MHLNWVLVASKMQSLRHGFAKRTTRIAPLLILRFKCRTAYPTKFWHCSVSMNIKDRSSKEKVITDLTFEEVYNQVIAPWHQQCRFSISGLVVVQLR
jgi:hypothetical protein